MTQVIFIAPKFSWDNPWEVRIEFDVKRKGAARYQLDIRYLSDLEKVDA